MLKESEAMVQPTFIPWSLTVGSTSVVDCRSLDKV